jgi:hypothetical protein
MFEFYRTRVPNRRADLLSTRDIYPAAQSFEQWLTRHRERMELALSA